VASFLQSHFEQVVGFLPLAVLVLDVGFKAMLGNRDLHSFGGDLSLCGFVVYLGAVLHVLDFAPETLKGTAMITPLFGVIGSLIVWFVTLFMGSFEVWLFSLLASAIGLYISSLCAQSAWSMLKI